MKFEDKAYSRLEIPTKMVNPTERFIESSGAPIDKEYIVLDEKLDLDWLKTLPIKRIPGKKYFSSRDAFALDHKGFVVFIFQNNYKTEFQLNLTQWDSFEGKKAFLKILMGRFYKQSVVTKLHCFIDLGLTLADAKACIEFPLIRKARKYSVVTTTRMSEVEEIECSTTFGSESHKVYALYDSAKRHGYEAPSTRIEARLNNRSTALIRHPDQLLLIGELNPFRKARIHKSIITGGLSKTEIVKLRDFEALLNKYGINQAFQTLRKENPSHFRRKYDFLFTKIFSTDSTELPDHFSKKLASFMSAAMSVREKSLLSECITAQRAPFIEERYVH